MSERERKLRFIRAARAIGFTLADMRVLLGAWSERQPSCGGVPSLIAKRLAEVDQCMRDLRHGRGVLRQTSENCKQSEASGCYVLGKSFGVFARICG